ncbi:peptide chain release factor H [Pseudomonas sp. BMS12]|uniref:peptide chain release factor H n=1 Tax=Pseudomonas sp. BMS12 TaxID=1796033 RepID=UPI00083A37D5|nr:peptide chain release factor H [Pseudomonas sp. BMS12]
MILLQLSAGQGPEECALAVAKALRRLITEAELVRVGVCVLEEEAGPQRGTLRSVLLALQGERAEELAATWNGPLQWICSSPYRPTHGRKNWFFGGALFAPPAASLESEIRFETLRSSGPGGQHVNTTDSAVRATHLASGISVKVQSERSQHANRRLALMLIARRLAERAEQADDRLRAERRLRHHQLERGNPRRIFRGERFIE